MELNTIKELLKKEQKEKKIKEKKRKENAVKEYKNKPLMLNLTALMQRLKSLNNINNSNINTQELPAATPPIVFD